MELHNKKAHEIIDMIKNKDIKVEEVVKGYLDRIDVIDRKIGAYLYIDKEGALNKARELDIKIGKGQKLNTLWGLPIGVKDNISVKGMQNTCGSKILQNYISPYDAHVITRLRENNGIIIGKLNMDEFAMGSSNENSSFKITKNPWDLNRVPGGSSGGSAAAVAAGEVPFALGTETGGSVRVPASFCGVVGFKPTYGRISRYGVVAFASTLDQVGIMSRDVKDCAILTEAMEGLDPKDFTTVDISNGNYTKNLNKNLKGKKIGIPIELFGSDLDSNVRKCVEDAIKVLKENGAEVKMISIPLIEYSLATYHIISTAEASSNLARFDGIRYGYRAKDLRKGEDMYIRSRTEGFGDEVKRRIMLGTYMLSKECYDKYYKKALKVRRLIIEDFKNIFRKFDAIVSPTTSMTAFKIGEKTSNALSMYMSDMYTVFVNLAGLPAISVPCGIANNLPVGFQIIGDYLKEDEIFNIAYSYEQSTNCSNMVTKL